MLRIISILMCFSDWYAAGDKMEASKSQLTPRRIEQMKQLASSNEKPRCFLCPDCGKGFRSNWDLTQHHMIHTGVKPHKCQFCDRSFRQRPHLKHHLYVHHPEELIHAKITMGNQ